MAHESSLTSAMIHAAFVPIGGRVVLTRRTVLCTGEAPATVRHVRRHDSPPSAHLRTETSGSPIKAAAAVLGVVSRGACVLSGKYHEQRGLQALASYSLSHSIDIASTDSSANSFNTPGIIDNANVDRGNSDFDIRHSFTAGLTYDLPSPGSQKFLRAAFGGWSLDSFVLARSAPPVNVVGATSFAANVVLASRPNVIPGVPLELFGSQYPGGKILNKAAFTPVPAGQQGNFGRNVLRGFGATQADLAFQRQFAFTEQLNLRFRAEFFNIFNHPNFGNPINDLTSPLIGHSTQTLANSLGSGGANGGFNPLYQIGGPRSIQLALKLQF